MIAGLALACLIAATAEPQAPEVLSRDQYGVPIIRAKSTDEAMEWAGYATAQDRMWQMEMSRRAARSQLAEVFGERSFSADLQQFQQFYTESEIRNQFERLPAKIQRWFKSYAKGVNRRIAEGNLPEQYAANDLAAKPWTVLDSAAITIQLLQTFGRGGSGELRNLALFRYLESQKAVGNRALDIFDDFTWQNDPASIPTCYPEDDKVKPPVFPTPNAIQTIQHLIQLPDLAVLELLPGVRVVDRTEAKAKAESLAAPFRSGSYCVVVDKARSKTGKSLLLSGPQMGFTVPSICHEISIHAPGLDVAGMTVAGVPGVMIGATPNAAWGLTTGVADTEDLYLTRMKDGKFEFDRELRPIKEVSVEVPVKSGSPKKLTKRTTDFGPIVYEVKSKFVGFARKRIYEGRELQSYEAVSGLWNVANKSQFEASVKRATMNFNCFIALKNGDIGWRYLGEVPKRSAQWDPRFPLPAIKDAFWTGTIPFEQMPSQWNPRRGWIANWNNKPTSWWPNLDSPAWGLAFRNGVITDQMTQAKYGVQDLESIVKNIGRTSTTYRVMKGFLPDGDLQLFNGTMIPDQMPAALYNRFLVELRNELFLSTTGNFAGPDNFSLVAQPDVMIKVLRGETKFNYLGTRTAQAVTQKAYERALETVKLNKIVYKPTFIPVAAGDPIPFRDRGTYLQIIEVGVGGKNVVTPGVAESGAHSNDQADLARNWSYKSMVIR